MTNIMTMTMTAPEISKISEESDGSGRGTKVLITKRQADIVEVQREEATTPTEEKLSQSTTKLNTKNTALYIPIVPIKQNPRKKTAKLANTRVESAGRVVLRPTKT